MWFRWFFLSLTINTTPSPSKLISILDKKKIICFIFNTIPVRCFYRLYFFLMIQILHIPEKILNIYFLHCLALCVCVCVSVPNFVCFIYLDTKKFKWFCSFYLYFPPGKISTVQMLQAVSSVWPEGEALYPHWVAIQG